ncbi:MAG: hypothetical protein IJC61_01335 [Oscillospiraceae bacterium]|nr:hypothetical protein [Oscillospiraceae bacterium]
MNEQTTAMMKTVIDKAEETFRAAERSFEIEGDVIERSSQRNTSGSMEMNLHLVHESRRICRELYVSHEAVIAALDAQCRAFLGQDVDGALVVRVAELIEEINNDSRNLGASYDVNVNGINEGTAALLSYQPSADALAAELFWQTQAQLLPDAAEARARYNAYAQAKRDEQYEKEKQRLERERQQKNAVRDELAAAERAREKQAAYRARVQQYDAALENYIYDVMLARRSNELRAQVAVIDGEIAKLQQKRSSLGLFDWAGREAVGSEIAQLQAFKAQLQSAEAADAYEQAMLDAVQKEVERYRAEVEDFIAQRFPYGAARRAYIEKYIAENGLFQSKTSMAAQSAAMRVLVEQGSMRPEAIRQYDPRFEKMDGSDMRMMMNTAYRDERGAVNRRRLENTPADEAKYNYSYWYTGEGIGKAEETGTDIPIDYEDESCAAVCPPVPDAAAFFENL